ncbi:hypothetical protein CASFOL_013752 [Castilleja foliolosa]|uniref:Uncharacterized protein n=1 Tax=Castilleja foliolosa TaxID=1961234 RepID=A0ABD3DMQ3_9LAMI
MGDSSMLHNSSLVQSESAISFPRYRRRPLRSRTYLALIGILSYSHTNSTQLQIQEVDGDDSQSRQVSKENGSIPPNEVNSKAVLVSLPNSKYSEDPVVKESSNGEDKENNGGFDCNQATTPKLDHINLATDGELEVAPANSISNGDSFVVENQTGDCAILAGNEHDDANIVLDNQMDDLGTMEELIVDEEFSIADYSDVLDSCFGMDMVTEPSKGVDDSKENDTVLKENILKETEHELQLKEMELEKLIFSSGAVNPSSCQNADEEIEEGEISGEAGVADASFDALNEDVASLGETRTEVVHAPNHYINKEEFTRNDDEERGCRQHQLSGPSQVDLVNKDCNSVKVGSRTTDGVMQDCHSQNVFHDSYMEIQRNSRIKPCSKRQSPPGSDVQENAAENQMATTSEKV